MANTAVRECRYNKKVGTEVYEFVHKPLISPFPVYLTKEGMDNDYQEVLVDARSSGRDIKAMLIERCGLPEPTGITSAFGDMAKPMTIVLFRDPTAAGGKGSCTYMRSTDPVRPEYKNTWFRLVYVDAAKFPEYFLAHELTN